jgi:hypothetical protein
VDEAHVCSEIGCLVVEGSAARRREIRRYGVSNGYVPSAFFAKVGNRQNG